MASDPKIVQYVEELDLLIIRDGEKLYHIDGDAIAGMFKAYMEGHGIDYDICEGCERKREDNTETLKVRKVDAIRYIRGQREDKASDCETCQNRKTCKDAPIPSRYYCVGYKPEAGSMRLIDADAFKAEGRKLYREAGWDLRDVHYSQMDVECNIDMMPIIEAEPFKAFAHWVASEVCNEGFEDMWSLGAFAEVACRKLYALGIVQKFRDEWVYVDKDELDGGENGI